MADITMCSGIGCKKSHRCYRHNARPDKMWQSYFVEPPIKNGECSEYWEMRMEKEKSEIVEILMKFFPDEPCNYNGMDEFADCDYCEKHCGNHDVSECWEHAISAKWYERMG